MDLSERVDVVGRISGIVKDFKSASYRKRQNQLTLHHLLEIMRQEVSDGGRSIPSEPRGMSLSFLDSSRDIVDVVRTSSQVDLGILESRVIGLEESLTGENTNVFGSDECDWLASGSGEEHSDDHESGESWASGEIVLSRQLLNRVSNLITHHKCDGPQDSVRKT